MHNHLLSLLGAKRGGFFENFHLGSTTVVGRHVLLLIHIVASSQVNDARISCAASERSEGDDTEILLNMCEKTQWLGRAPILSNYREPAVRIRFLTRQQARAFIMALSQDWMRDICRFALATGMRSAEILTLTWDKVDLKRSTAWVSADASKSGSARVVPLNSEALDVLNARPKGVNVFTRPTGAPVKQVDAREFLPGPSPQPVSRISASTTCDIPGQADMSNPARPCSC